MIRNLQHTGPTPPAPTSWKVALKPLPQLDGKDFPLFHNWDKTSTSKDCGMSFGNKVSIVSDPENTDDDVKPMGLGRGKHTNKRKKTNGSDQAGLLWFLVHENGEDYAKEEKKVLNLDVTTLFKNLYKCGMTEDQFHNFNCDVVQFIKHSLLTKHHIFCLCSNN